jgi:hypothetical protein
MFAPMGLKNAVTPRCQGRINSVLQYRNDNSHMPEMAAGSLPVLEYSAVFNHIKYTIGVLVFISNAYAQTATAADPGLMGSLTTFAP